MSRTYNVGKERYVGISMFPAAFDRGDTTVKGAAIINKQSYLPELLIYAEWDCCVG